MTTTTTTKAKQVFQYYTSLANTIGYNYVPVFLEFIVFINVIDISFFVRVSGSRLNSGKIQRGVKNLTYSIGSNFVALAISLPVIKNSTNQRILIKLKSWL